MCMGAGKALADLHMGAASPEPSLLADVISTEILCSGLNALFVFIELQ